MKQTAFGLDFGTTNSTLSINRGGEARIVDIDPTAPSATTMRTVLYFDPTRKIYAGEEAIQRYLDDDAEGRLVQSIKTLLGSSLFSGVVINNRYYSLEDLITVFLRIVKHRGEAIIGESVDSVVIGRPAVFADDPEENRLAEERLKIAVENAGFKNIVFQFEPIAAAFTYEASIPSGQEKKVLVGDFGGGTSDFAVIRLRGGMKPGYGDRKEDILSVCGVPVGGDIFDSRIMSERLIAYYGANARYKGMRGQWMEVPKNLFSMLSRWHLMTQLRERKQRESIRQIRGTCDDVAAFERLEDLIDYNYGFKLFQAIEKAKCMLSSQDEVALAFSELKSDVHEIITSKEFGDMVAVDLLHVEESATKSLHLAGLVTDDIDTVFITGGSSDIPAIQKIFVDKFGKEKLASADAFTSVGYGLGLAASYLFK